MSDLTLYEYDDILKQIELRAEEHGGELTEEDVAEIVKAQTGSIEKLGRLFGYMKFLNRFTEIAQMEIDAVKAKQKAAQNRLESVKKYLTPYIREHGGKVSVGIHTASIRKSKAVVTADGFDNLLFCTVKTVTTPDKQAIKKAIESGVDVAGAVLEERENVIIR